MLNWKRITITKCFSSILSLICSRRSPMKLNNNLIATTLKTVSYNRDTRNRLPSKQEEITKTIYLFLKLIARQFWTSSIMQNAARRYLIILKLFMKCSFRVNAQNEEKLLYLKSWVYIRRPLETSKLQLK